MDERSENIGAASTVTPATGAQDRRGPPWRILWPVALITTIVYASAHQIVALPPTPIGMDKVGHFLMFGLLATHIVRLPRDRHRRLTLLQGVIAVVVTSLFGVSDEFHQAMNPYRSFDYYDMLADFLGALVAVGLYQYVRFYRELLELPIPPRRQKLV